MALLAFEHLTFTYAGAPSPALCDVGLVVEPGEYVVLAGLSGCGKTTLLRQLKPALAPAGERSGRVLVNGTEVDALPLRGQARTVGFVLQDPDDQIVCDTVLAELAFGLENIGCDRDAMGLRVAEAANFFGMQEWLHRSTASLSGGQKQLLNLAAVMALEPAVLVLDEPTSQLDPVAARSFLALVRRINRELGVTVVMAEHHLEEVLADADRLVVMEGGRIVADGAPRVVGARLCAERHLLGPALPAALQAYEGLRLVAPRGMASADLLPLTVREGRLWLQQQLPADPGSLVAPDPAPGLAPERASQPADTDVPPALALRDVRFRYDRNAPDVLRDLSLTVPTGSLFALVGGNGSGKSTVLKAACGLVRPYRGSVSLFGRKRGRRAADGATTGVALLPQDPTLLFAYGTVGAELAEMGADDAAVTAMAEQCRIGGLLGSHPLDLSGGQRQQAALAKLLLTDPRLLLLDEPTKGLDVAAKAALATQLTALAARGVTVLLVSHDLEFCARFADAVALLFDGAVVSHGAPRRFFAGARFYTTAANRMARDRIPEALTPEDIVACCREEAAHGA